MKYSEKELKETFNKSFIKGSTTFAKEEMSQWKRDASKELNMDEELISISFGYYLLLDIKTGERIQDPFHIGKQGYPTRKNTLEVYTEAINRGFSDFQIDWQTDGHYYSTYADKFRGNDEPFGDGTNTTLLITKIKQ